MGVYVNQEEMSGDIRTHERIYEHYLIEKELASRLRNASKQERRQLYSSLYNELFQRVPDHPQLTKKSSPLTTSLRIEPKVKFLASFLKNDMTFLEIGPGDCALSLELTKSVKQVYAVDVSDEITKISIPPDNFKLILSDGSEIPVPQCSVDVAYSDQLMEHLHPDDAIEQLHNIYNALRPGGIYICITPNKLFGPTDVSRSFDKIATGFHLKEYTISELCTIFKKARFSKIRGYLGGRGIYVKCFIFPLVVCEMLLNILPHRFRQSKIFHSFPLRQFRSIKLVGYK